jgi:hypothetical protein
LNVAFYIARNVDIRPSVLLHNLHKRSAEFTKL